jgi:heat shock protein HtpX
VTTNAFQPLNFFEQIRSNNRRSMVLMTATFVVLYLFTNLIAGAFGAYTKTGACSAYSTTSCGTVWYWNPIALSATAVLVAGYLLLAYRMSAKAALAITKAHPADGPEYLQLRNVVEGVAIAAGIPMPAVYVVDDPAPNAFATGLKPEKAAVAVTTGLLAKMSRRELEGVLAHEIGHIRNRDTSFMTLVVLTVGAIMVLSTVLVRIGYYATVFMGGGGRRSRSDNNESGAAIGLVLLAIGWIGFVIAVPSAMLLKAALSRRREVMADATAVELTRNPSGIRSALEKLEADTTVVKAMSTTTAHLWIESPLERGKEQGFVGSVGRLFDSHPPLADRIAVLRRYEGLDPSGRGPVDPGPGVMPPIEPRRGGPLPPPHGPRLV